MGKMILLLVWLISAPLFASDLADLFQEHALEGTIVISSADGKVTYVHNEERAKEPLSPASTFKIPNALIAMDLQLFEDENESVPWDGVERMLPIWNQDHSLKSAFQASYLAFFQEIAKRVGREEYQRYLEMFSYGNQEIGNDVTAFWVDGSLKISPYQQVQFLRDFYKRKYPLSYQAYTALNEMMRVESLNGYELFVKTGAATSNWEGHGWYVGYVVVNEEVWFFATNILISCYDDLKKREAITRACLKRKGVLPTDEKEAI